MGADQLDYSLPISALIWQASKHDHERIGQSPGAKALTSGAISREAYAKYLFSLWHLYDTLETALDKLYAYPTLAPSYNPALLRRTDAISSDIAHILDCPSTSPSAWQRHKLYTESFLPFPPPLARYLNRLNELAQAEDPTPLLAHTYVRYLGDMSGGQFIKRTLLKANIVESDAISLYEFGKLGTGGEDPSGMGDLRKLKDAFKAGMNAGVGDDLARKRDLVDEARLAFQMNSDILSTLVLPTVDYGVPVEPTEGPPLTSAPIASPGGIRAIAATCGRAFIPYAGVALTLVLSHAIVAAASRTKVVSSSAVIF